MKKLLSILSFSTFLLIFSNNTISCFGRNKETGITDKTITDQLIPSAESASWYSNLSKATNISLLKGRQLIVSNVQNDNPISDVNLDFSGNKEIYDGCASSEKYFVFYDNKLYSKQGCDSKLWYFDIGNPDENENYWPSSHHQLGIVTKTLMPTISNDNVYAISSDKNIIYNATDIGNITEVSNLNNFSDFSEVTNLKFIYNISGSLYVGTNNGLYKSTDDGQTYILINKTKNLSINSIIGSTNTIYFGTDANGLWDVNVNSTSAIQINNTQDKKINYSSLSIINNNLYFGMENEGLYVMNNLSPASINRLVGTHISETDNIKTVIVDANNNFLVLTNSNIVKIPMAS